MAISENLKPTDSELEILQVIWEKNEATVREVHEALSVSKDVGYTTTLKLMQIMQQKGLVDRDASLRSHIYSAAFEKEAMQIQLLKSFIQKVYSGSAKQMIVQILKHNSLSKEDLLEIQLLINKLNK